MKLYSFGAAGPDGLAVCAASGSFGQCPLPPSPLHYPGLLVALPRLGQE